MKNILLSDVLKNGIKLENITIKFNPREWEYKTLTCQINIKLEKKENQDRRYSYLDPNLFLDSGFLEASLSGGIRRVGHWGQIVDHLRGGTCNNHAKTLALKTIIAFWDRYHLNTFSAGTAIQNEYLDKYKKNMKIDRKLEYEEEVDILNNANLLVDRGYRYGTKWLAEEIPLKEIDNLFNAVTTLDHTFSYARDIKIEEPTPEYKDPWGDMVGEVKQGCFLSPSKETKVKKEMDIF